MLQDAFASRANQRSQISATFPVWSHRKNLGLNSALPLKDSDTALDTQITHTRGGRQSLAPVDVNTRERKQREQETVSHSECE